MNPNPSLAADIHHRLRIAINRGDGVFSLEESDYPCSATFLPERYCNVSNNDHGLKRILLDVHEAKDLVIEGNGAHLIFFGEVMPVRIGASTNITLRNLSIDWFRPFFSQAEITASGEGFIEFRADPDRYPLSVDQGRLVARDHHGWQTDSMWNILPFDPVRREVSHKGENWHINRWHRAREISPGHIRIEANFTDIYEPGTPIVIMHGNRVAPGIWIEESCGVTLENVTLHHAPAMGVVAQCSRDVTLDRVKVVPSGDRLFSTWVDATHFVDCHGHTLMKGCELSGQFDDASNIHAAFYKVIEHPDSHTARLQTIHPQRYGPNAIKPADGVAFHLHSTMESVLVSRCVSSKTINQEIVDLVIEHPLPTDVPLVARRYEPGPENLVEVRDCYFGANRGRGLLLNMEHRTLIENNRFHVSGRAIESMPDANYWWEAGPFEDMTIRGNLFEDCNFGPCGDTLMHVGPELPDGSDPRRGAFRSTSDSKEAEQATSVLRNLLIEDNTIISHSSQILHASGIDGIIVRNNKVLDSTNYPLQDTGPTVILGPGVINDNIDI